MNIGWISTGKNSKTCKSVKIPYFQLNYKRRQSKGEAFALLLTEQCRKILKGFYSDKRCHYLGEFSRISGSKRSLAVCTTVVQFGILRLIIFLFFYQLEKLLPSCSVSSMVFIDWISRVISEAVSIEFP